MIIYNKVVINMSTNKIVEADWFNYTGRVALCAVAAPLVTGVASAAMGAYSSHGGDSAPSYPAISPQEEELLQLQLDQLKQAGEDAEVLRPYILASMGLKEIDGEMIKMTEEEYYESLSGLDQKGYEVALASAERSLKAYAGELDISPALEKNLTQRKTELEENLSRNLGSGWQGTTAGIQAMAQFDETSNLIREEVRSGIISNEGAMSLSSLDYMSGISGTSMASFPAQQTGGLFGAAGQLAGQYGQERYRKWQASAHAAQVQAQRQAGMMSGFGQLAGAGIQAYGAYMAAG